MPGRNDDLGLPPIAPWLVGLLVIAIFATYQWGWLGLLLIVGLVGLGLVVLSRSGASVADALHALQDETNRPAFAIGTGAIVVGAFTVLVAWKVLRGVGTFESVVVLLSVAAFITWVAFAARALGLINVLHDPGTEEDEETPPR